LKFDHPAGALVGAAGKSKSSNQFMTKGPATDSARSTLAQGPVPQHKTVEHGAEPARFLNDATLSLLVGMALLCCFICFGGAITVCMSKLSKSSTRTLSRAASEYSVSTELEEAEIVDDSPSDQAVDSKTSELLSPASDSFFASSSEMTRISSHYLSITQIPPSSVELLHAVPWSKGDKDGTHLLDAAP